MSLKVKQIFFLFGILLLTASLSSCAFIGYHNGFAQPLLPAAEIRQEIIKDCIALLTKTYPPGHTSFSLVTSVTSKKEKEETDPFSIEFETALRKKGFSISPTANVRLGWLLDALPPEKGARNQNQINENGAIPHQWYIRLILSANGQQHSITRVYDPAGRPVAGFAAGEQREISGEGGE